MNKTINILLRNDYPAWDIAEDEFVENTKKIAGYFLQNYLNKSCLEKFNFKTLTFDILFCSSKTTHELNKKYRGKDYPADIITFALFADATAKLVLDNEINLGEIILALDKVSEEAEKHKVSAGYELYFLTAHGILHLLGFDHKTEEEYNFIINAQKKALEYQAG